MNENPLTLKDLCINYVCNNIEQLYVADDTSDVHPWPEDPEYMFIDKNVYLPMEVSEVLLTKLSVRNKLNDEILSLFSHKNVYLRFVFILKSVLISKSNQIIKLFFRFRYLSRYLLSIYFSIFYSRS